MTTAQLIGAAAPTTSPPIPAATARPTAGATTRARLAAVRGVGVQLGLLALATVAYLGVRALTQGDPGAAVGNAHDVLRVERALGLDWERGAQALVLDHGTLVRWFNAVYVWAFWPFVALALIVLYRRDRGRYRVLRNAMFASGAAGLAVFAVFPVAPPRFLDGFTDTVALVSGQDHLAHPSAFSNEYAAIPSFHVGWTVLAAVCLLPVLRWTVVRAFVVVHGVVMAVTVVVTANHYVVDGAIGVAVSLAGLAVAARVLPALRRRHAPEGRLGLSGLLVEEPLPAADAGQVERAA
jgi:hypothetical protein